MWPVAGTGQGFRAKENIPSQRSCWLHPQSVLAGLEEALIASLADAEGGDAAAAAPPASKRAVKSLLREQLTDARLQQLGGDGTQCAVCRYVVVTKH